MTIRHFTLASAVVGFAMAASALLPAFAQNLDVIDQRQKAMKAIGGAAKASGQMLKGEVAFDAAKAVEIFTTIHDNAVKFGTLFPDDSKTGGKTEASPKIWEQPDAFKAKLAKFQGDAMTAMAAKPATLDAFKASFGAVAANCKSCHEEFRVDK